MNRMLPARLVWIALVFPMAAWAKTSDRNQQMLIDSNNNDCNLLKDNEKCRFTGNVVITQGTLEIHADTADIFQKDGQTNRIVLIGKQARLKQEMDDGSTVHGTADNIEYKVTDDIVILTGNYKVESPKGTNTGQKMVYNTKTGDMQSGGDGNRVHTVIQPKNPAAASSGSKPAIPAASKPHGKQ